MSFLSLCVVVARSTSYAFVNPLTFLAQKLGPQVLSAVIDQLKSKLESVTSTPRFKAHEFLRFDALPQSYQTDEPSTEDKGSGTDTSPTRSAQETKEREVKLPPNSSSSSFSSPVVLSRDLSALTAIEWCTVVLTKLCRRAGVGIDKFTSGTFSSLFDSLCLVHRRVLWALSASKDKRTLLKEKARIETTKQEKQKNEKDKEKRTGSDDKASVSLSLSPSLSPAVPSSTPAAASSSLPRQVSLMAYQQTLSCFLNGTARLVRAFVRLTRPLERTPPSKDKHRIHKVPFSTRSAIRSSCCHSFLAVAIAFGDRALLLMVPRLVCLCCYLDFSLLLCFSPSLSVQAKLSKMVASVLVDYCTMLPPRFVGDDTPYNHLAQVRRC